MKLLAGLSLNQEVEQWRWSSAVAELQQQVQQDPNQG